MQRIYKLFLRSRSTLGCSKYSKQDRNHHHNFHSRFNPKLTTITGCSLLFSGAALVNLQNSGEKEAPVRIVSLRELAEMCAKGRIVVAYRGSLYDMTNFTGHPGGVG